MNRTPNHTLTGEPYTRTLAQRADLACEAIGRMASEGRGPRMSIPAGRNLHSTPPGDEDLFITDVIEDLQAEVERLRLDLSTSEDKLAHATQAVVALRARVPNPDDLREVLDVVRWVSYPDSRPGQAQARVRATMEEA